MAREKIALIIPPSPFLANERVFPFLGPLKVASALREQGREVDVLDLSGVQNYNAVVTSYVDQEGYNIQAYGLTATTPQFPQAVEIVERIHESSDKKVILGGAHATMVGTAAMQDQAKGREGRGALAYNQMMEIFDTVVIGDGEKAMLPAVETDERVIDAGDYRSPYFLQRGTLQDYPLPARDLIDLSSYHYQIDGKDAQSMIAQLGCPFGCGFCGGRDTPVLRVARTRPTEHILGEVRELVEVYGKEGIMFYDDELNIKNGAAIDLMKGLIDYQEREGLDLRLRGFVRADLFTQEQADLMYQAGFRIMLSGVESGDGRILDNMQKRTTPEINSQWVKTCRESGLQVKALMSIGHPGETEETVRNSLRWVLENNPDDVDWTVITEYPGSPYFDHSVQENGVWTYTAPTGARLHSRVIDYAKEANYYKGIPGDYTSYVWTDELSPERLVELRDECEKTSREALGLAPIQITPALQHEHSMGQQLPNYILRSTSG